MECSEIVEKYLKENKYHGLFNVDYKCACAVIELGPCNDGVKADCSTGYVQVEEREDGLVIGAYHPKLCPDCKTRRDFGPLGFKLPCPECGHDDDVNFVECPGCSEAGGAGVPVKHLPPVCSEKEAYFTCTSCGLELNRDEVFAAVYSRTCASGELRLCPQCGTENNIERGDSNESPY